MNRLTVQTIKFSLVGFAGVLLFCPALVSPSAVSSYTGKQAQIGTVPNQNVILFKRRSLDTEARADLDTSDEDQQAMSAMSASRAKQIRVVQFARVPLVRAFSCTTLLLRSMATLYRLRNL